MLAGVGVVGIIFGMNMGTVQYRDREVEVEKIVEVQDQTCRDAMHNFTVSQEVIGQKDAGIKILLDIVGSMDYYMYNPTALDRKVAEAEDVIENLRVLETQYR